MSERTTIKIGDRNDPNQNVGEATLGKNKKGSGNWLQGLFVKEDKRGQGYGKELINQAVQSSPGGLSLEVRTDNTTAVNLYQDCGFEIYDIITDKSGNQYYRMRKTG